MVIFYKIINKISYLKNIYIFVAPNGHSEKVQELDPLTGHRQISQTTPVDPTSYCGLGSFQPKWARSLASTHVFMVVFLFAWVLQVSSVSRDSQAVTILRYFWYF